MPSFELNTPDWFTPQNVAPNDYLNDKLTTDQYGKYYSVQFEGSAETYLWQTKTEPEIGKAYWGQLEMAKTGKSIKFKKLKEEDSQSTPSNASSNSETTDKQSSIYRSVALNNAATVYTGIVVDPLEILALAELMNKWLVNEVEPQETEKS